MDRMCCRCGAAITLDDLEQRRAVIVMKRPYCERCSDRIAASGGTTRRKLPFDTVALPGLRDHPRLLSVAMILQALAAVAYLLFARRPF